MKTIHMIICILLTALIFASSAFAAGATFSGITANADSAETVI